ncbi:hypothetical protein AA103581_1197 [Gluconobacter wancherniae NBRC 103581]|nr:hypothetical protein AA103581_1197 [Gluconobacter wancherniae NBRC 103581]
MTVQICIFPHAHRQIISNERARAMPKVFFLRHPAADRVPRAPEKTDEMRRLCKVNPKSRRAGEIPGQGGIRMISIQPRQPPARRILQRTCRMKNT